MKFSEKLMNLRKSKGISQEELANKLNVTRQTVSKWELDQTTPDMNKLIAISNLFEISLDELVNDIETSTPENVYKESAVEKNNKKISIKILIVGLILACILCGIGLIRQNNAKKTNEENYNISYQKSAEKVEVAKKRLEEINSEIKTLNPQINNIKLEISTMQNENQKIFSEDFGYSDRYNAKAKEIQVKQSELSQLQSQLTDLEMEKFQLENADYTVYYSLVKPITYLIFYYIGAGILFVSALISLIYFLITRKK